MVFLQDLYYVLSIPGRGLFIMMIMMMMMMMNKLVFAGPTGLTLKLIHRDSPESPLYQGNLTQLERIERAFQQSIHREKKLLSTWHRMKQPVSSSSRNNRKSDTDTVRPEVNVYDTTSYMVKLGIGTFPNSSPSYLEYNFYIDTGSDLLWLQCDATRTGASKEPKYFKQDAKIFNRGEYSSTYNPLRSNSTNVVCRKYADDKHVPAEGNGYCGYRVAYADGANTEGVLATEKLTVVNTDNGGGGTEEINDFVFGCGYRQNEPDFGKGELNGTKHPLAGMLGLGGGKGSFIRQLGDRVDNKFEHCFIPWYDSHYHDTHTFLRFGSDTRIVVGGAGVKTTRTIPVRGETLYYVIMEGISIEGEAVVYPQGSNVFEAKQDGTGGVIFDSGSTETTLSEEVYVPLMAHLIKYFYKKKIRRAVPSEKFSLEKYELCFTMREGFNEFPDITFHFDGGADFVMEYLAVFTGDEEMFCLLFPRSNLTSAFSVIHGSMQQGDYRILYDVGARTISWVSETCATDP